MVSEPMTSESMVEKVARAVREEIVRQYRESERQKCPAGVNFYEECVGPYLIACAAIAAMTPTPPQDGETG